MSIKGQDIAKELTEANEKLRIITHLSAQDEAGEDFFFIIAVQPLFYESFMRLSEIDEGQISQFGEILYRGKGEMPDENIIRELKEKFGATYNFVSDMKEAVREAKLAIDKQHLHNKKAGPHARLF